jgi:hypothetical protein
VTTAMHVPEFFQRALRSSFALKEYTFPNETSVEIQGYEHFALNDLLDSGISEDDLIEGYDQRPVISYELDGVQRKYYPDIYIPRFNVVIEIKSEWTFSKDEEKTIAKMHATAQAGFDTELLIYAPNGKLLRTELFPAQHTNNPNNE